MILKIGHDVADDMYEAGMQQVTMVQRNRTCKYVWQRVGGKRLTTGLDVLPLEYIEDRYKGKLTKAEHPSINAVDGGHCAN
jgi:hypothetical protein